MSKMKTIKLSKRFDIGHWAKDNPSPVFHCGAPDTRWDNDMLHLLDVLTGNDFEAVDTSVLMVDVNSGEAK
jgi:hypothetical protein